MGTKVFDAKVAVPVYKLYSEDGRAVDRQSFFTKRGAEEHLQSLRADFGKEVLEGAEVQLEGETSMELVVTTAPEDYDGGTTERIAELGAGKTLALVEADNLQWQTLRYRSGMEVGMTLGEYVEKMLGGRLISKDWALLPNSAVRPVEAARRNPTDELLRERLSEEAYNQAAEGRPVAEEALSEQAEEITVLDVEVDLVYVGDLFRLSEEVIHSNELPMGELLAPEM